MALKKGMFESYIKERETPLPPSKSVENSKYSHNRVFDEPESLKRIVDDPTISQENVEATISLAVAPTHLTNACSDDKTVSNGFKNHEFSKNSNEMLSSSEIYDSKLDAQTFHMEHGSENESIKKDDNSNGFNRVQKDSNGFKSTSDQHKQAITRDKVLVEPSPNKTNQYTHLNGFNRIQKVSDETVSNGFKEVQTVSSETVSNGFKGIQTVSETVSKKPSLSELKLLHYLLQKQGDAAFQRAGAAKDLNLKLAGIKTALTRLKSKGYIKLQTCSKGRYTGYTSYTLTPIAYELLSIPETIELLGFKRFQTVSETVSKFSISSSNKDNTTTALPEDWKKINFSPLESIGFSEQHLLDIYSANSCDSTVVQESIYHFAFGLEEGRHKSYDSPLKVFIGRLRKGNAWIESNYESAKEKALRELLARKKAEKEKRDSMIKELVEIEFPEWRKKLTSNEIKNIVPAETLKANLAPAITAALRKHYIDNILMPKLGHENIRIEDEISN